MKYRVEKERETYIDRGAALLKHGIERRSRSSYYHCFLD